METDKPNDKSNVHYLFGKKKRFRVQFDISEDIRRFLKMETDKPNDKSNVYYLFGKKKRSRIQFDISEEVKNVLEDMQNELRAPDKTEILRDALRIYLNLMETYREGYGLIKRHEGLGIEKKFEYDEKDCLLGAYAKRMK